MAQASEQDGELTSRVQTLKTIAARHGSKKAGMGGGGIQRAYTEQRKERTQNTITIFGWIVVIEKTRLSSVLIRALENQSDG